MYRSQDSYMYEPVYNRCE